MKTQFMIDGDKQLIHLFGALPKHVSTAVVRDALSKGGGIVKQAAVANAQAIKDTGLLAKSITVRSAKRKTKGSQLAVVGPKHMKTAMRRTAKGTLRKIGKAKLDDFRAGGGTVIYYDPGNYAHLVEFGTRAHTIRPETKKAMVLPSGKVIRSAAHPGTKPNPFMRRATDASAQKALAAVNDKLWRGITEQVARMRKK